MRIAILGATGFIGYDFTRLLMEEHEITPVVYSTSATSLTNISRHDIPVRLVSYPDLAEDGIDTDFDFIVNFSHPFGERGGFSQEKQISTLATVLSNALEKNAKLRLIHISTMSVYEPFAQGKQFPETSICKPPKKDAYASSKVMFDQLLLKNDRFADRILLPRPTIVYGPYCRPWTDGIFSGFLAGDVTHTSLDGNIQPLYVRDLSRFLWQAMNSFSSGPLNIGGTETTTWKTFLEHFQAIANRGQLTPVTSDSDESPEPSFKDDLRIVAHTLFNEPAFQHLLGPVVKHIPKQRRRNLMTSVRENAGKILAEKRVASAFESPFFAEDRLVNTELFQQRYPDFKFTPLADTADVLGRYLEYRFSDKMLGNR